MVIALFCGAAARAQDQVWVQIEALPTLSEAQDRARAYAAVFPETVGYRLPSGWYALALGPYGVGEGASQLAGLRRENLIPGDSFIAYGNDFRDQFWPAGADGLPAPDPAPVPAPALPLAAPEAITQAPLAAPDTAQAAVTPEPEETPAEARRSEAALTPADREALQTALQWFGHYAGTIDGAFGPGTRGSMADWQSANGVEPTGILTTAQRSRLTADYQAALSAFGFTPITEPEAGIDITLPLALVEFDHYEPPFVHFRAKAGSGLSVILISQPGDQSSLYGLYDVLQTLEVMPLNGERSRDARSFSLRGTSATVDATAYAELKGGLIKGWMLVSMPGQAGPEQAGPEQAGPEQAGPEQAGPEQAGPERAERDARVLATLRQTFRPQGDRALDPGMVAMDATAKRGLLAGLEVRRPRLSRSGFFIDAEGRVLTTTDAVQSCGRVTLDRGVDGDVTLLDEGLGLAIVTPRMPLSPPAIAGFQAMPGRIGSEVAASGYSYEDKLPAPVLTFGTLEDVTDLTGGTARSRLTLNALPGDAGGPVLDGTGAVIGMLLPATVEAGKQLPPEVALVANAASVTARLTAAGLAPRTSTARGALAPEDLSRSATGMTVLVSCWD